MRAHPRSARMGEMGQHARMAAWDGGRGTCVKPFDCLPNMTPQLNATGGGQGTVLIRAPLSGQRKELEPKRRWRGGEERFWGKWCVKRPARMSQHWKRPVISPDNGFRVRFSGCKLSRGYAQLPVSEDRRGQRTQNCLLFHKERSHELKTELKEKSRSLKGPTNWESQEGARIWARFQ